MWTYIESFLTIFGQRINVLNYNIEYCSMFLWNVTNSLYSFRNMAVKAVRIKRTERGVQSPGRKEGAPLGGARRLTGPLPLLPALPLQKRIKGKTLKFGCYFMTKRYAT